MDVNVLGRGCNINSTNSNSATQQSEEDQMDLRRGPWTVEEDIALMNYIANHGEGRWNSLARCAGLRRTGKSCRLRWLNYLRPDVRRGNITLEEQLLILELHSRWGNRWSKIAQHLPGRTDNEIKNYWRTRVQKHAKQLQCDVNSKQFKDAMRYLWMPRLVERIRASSSSATPPQQPDNNNYNNYYNHHHQELATVDHDHHHQQQQQQLQHKNNYNNPSNFMTPDNSSTATSSDSLGPQVSPASDLKDYYTTFHHPHHHHHHHQAVENNPIIQCCGISAQTGQINYPEFLTNPSGYFNQGLEFDQGVDQQNNNNNNNINNSSMWLGGGDTSDNLWNVEDMWFLQQQLSSGF